MLHMDFNHNLIHSDENIMNPRPIHRISSGSLTFELSPSQFFHLKHSTYRETWEGLEQP